MSSLTHITFLFGAADRQSAAADWLAQRSLAKQSALVLLPDEEALISLDRLLWTRSTLGFTPHCRADSPLARETPILLAQAIPENYAAGCVLNLCNQLPSDFSNIPEIIELISQDVEERAFGRDRFRAYREAGLAIESIDISAGLPQ